MPRWLDREFVWVQNPTSSPSPPNRNPPPQPNSMRLRWSRATPPRSTTRPTRCSPPTCTVVPRPLLSTSAPSVVLPTVYARLTRYETGSFVFVSMWFATGLLKLESRYSALSTRVSGQVIVAPMSFTPTPSSIGPVTTAIPISPPMPWPKLFPNLEYCVRPRASGFTGLGPLKIESRSEEHTSELQSQSNLVCRLLLE